MKPTLKKVSKYENKFAKLQKKAAEFNFRNQLKVVKKKEFTLEEEDKEVFFRQTWMHWHGSYTNFTNLLLLLQKKPDWSKQKDEKKVKEEVEVDAWLIRFTYNNLLYLLLYSKKEFFLGNIVQLVLFFFLCFWYVWNIRINCGSENIYNKLI